MRKKIITKSAGLLMVILMVGFTSNAQTGNWWEKITWSFSVEKIDDSHAYVVGKGELAEHWHVYSVDHDPAKADFTGVPTEFRFIDSPNYKTIGKLKDGIKPKTHEDVLGTHLFFEHKAVFKQKIEVLTDKAFEIDFGYTFQVCDENGCLFPPEQEGKVKVSGFLMKSEESTKDDEIEEIEFSKVNGDEAKGVDGNSYVNVNDQWYKVPQGNSIEFYKQYLKLGGKHEE